jgi:hypothetical protein
MILQRPVLKVTTSMRGAMKKSHTHAQVTMRTGLVAIARRECGDPQ